MTTFFDLVTVACFVAMAVGFFQLTDRDTRTLVHLILAGIVFAVANQVGNHGANALAAVLILAGIGYAFVVVRR